MACVEKTFMLTLAVRFYFLQKHPPYPENADIEASNEQKALPKTQDCGSSQPCGKVIPRLEPKRDSSLMYPVARRYLETKLHGFKSLHQ